MPQRSQSLLNRIETVLLFVQDINAAANWYAKLLDVEVRHENLKYAFVRGPGVLIGFHPADSKCPGGVGGTTVYWEVEDLKKAVAVLQEQGAVLHRGPAQTDFGAKVAMLVDPFGCTIGLNESTSESRRNIHAESNSPSAAQGAA
jgi:predicted enzyme related to lactoylglutathione lyase